jgi:hypothetical protein
MGELNEITPKELLLSIRNVLSNKQITFIQVGVNDGIAHDIAVDILREDDKGVFIEPMEQPFNKMLINKSNFKYSNFLKKAVLPKNLKIPKMNLLSEDPSFEGVTFSNLNSHRIIGSIDVETITPKKIIEDYNISELDFLFCDAEQMDHLIILDFLEEIIPNVLFFETCWWCTNDFELELSDGNKVTVPSREKIKERLESLGYVVINYWESEVNRREDILAIQNKYINFLKK